MNPVRLEAAKNTVLEFEVCHTEIINRWVDAAVITDRCPDLLDWSEQGS